MLKGILEKELEKILAEISAELGPPRLSSQLEVQVFEDGLHGEAASDDMAENLQLYLAGRQTESQHEYARGDFPLVRRECFNMGMKVTYNLWPPGEHPPAGETAVDRVIKGGRYSEDIIIDFSEGGSVCMVVMRYAAPVLHVSARHLPERLHRAACELTGQAYEHTLYANEVKAPYDQEKLLGYVRECLKPESEV